MAVPASRQKRVRDTGAAELTGFLVRHFPKAGPQCTTCKEPAKEAVMLGPHVAEGTPPLYCQQCFADHYVPSNLTKFQQESAGLGTAVRGVNHGDFCLWLASLRVRYSPLPREGCVVDWTEAHWDWAGRWIGTYSDLRAQRAEEFLPSKQHSIFKREALVMASLLQHFPFIVVLGVQFYRHLHLQAVRETAEEAPLLVEFPVTATDRQAGTTLGACEKPSGVVEEGDISMGVKVRDFLCVLLRPAITEAKRSKAEWLASQLADGIRFTDLRMLALFGQADILSIILDPEVAWSEVELEKCVMMAVLSSDAPVPILKIIFTQSPTILRTDVEYLFMCSAGVVDIVLRTEWEPQPDDDNLFKKMLGGPFGVNYLQCDYDLCKVIVDPAAPFPERSMGRYLSSTWDWTELLLSMLNLEEYEDEYSRFSMFMDTEFLQILRLLVVVRGLTLPASWCRTENIPTPVRDLASIQLWSWLTEHLQEAHGKAPDLDASCLVHLFYRNYEEEEELSEEELQQLHALFVTADLNGCLQNDEEYHVTPHVRPELPRDAAVRGVIFSPVGAAIAFQPLEVLQELVSCGAQIKTEHLWFACHCHMKQNSSAEDSFEPISESHLMLIIHAACRGNGCDLNVLFHDSTPFLEIVRDPSVSPELVEKLIVNYGASVEPVNDLPSPLHVATAASTVRVLLEQHADVNGQDQSTRDTPLHTAVRSTDPNDLDTSRLVALLVGGAKMFSNAVGDTPLHIAAAQGWRAGLLALVHFYESHDTEVSSAVSINHANKEGNTVIQISEQQGDPVIIGMLQPFLGRV